MRWRNIGMKAVIAGALTLGMVVGLGMGLVGRSSLASAQTETQTTTDKANLVSRFFDQLAVALGIQRTELDSAVSSAASQTLSTAVADGTITQAQADRMNERLQGGDFGAFFGGRGGRHAGPMVAGLREAVLGAAAQSLGMTVDELHTALHDGQTIADLAVAKGTTEQVVQDAALAAAKTTLDQAVAAGTITQVQADQIYTHMQERGLMERGPGGHGGRGHHGRP